MFIEGGTLTAPAPPVVIEPDEWFVREREVKTDDVALMAERLDTLWPDWYRGIDLDKLDLNSGQRCVLGQGTARWSWFPPLRRKIQYGFGSLALEDHAMQNKLPHLSPFVFFENTYIPAWRAEILKRHAAR
jgi:hypothetical protein